MNKLLLLIFATLSLALFAEIGYFAYIKFFSHDFYSLSSVSLKKDYDTWLKKNSEITRSRLVNPDNNTHLIINQTTGILKSLSMGKEETKVAIQTEKGPVDYTFSSNGLKTYVKPANTKEVLVPIKSDVLKAGDSVVIHESYAIKGDKIINTDNGIVKLE